MGHLQKNHYTDTYCILTRPLGSSFFHIQHLSMNTHAFSLVQSTSFSFPLSHTSSGLGHTLGIANPSL